MENIELFCIIVIKSLFCYQVLIQHWKPFFC